MSCVAVEAFAPVAGGHKVAIEPFPRRKRVEKQDQAKNRYSKKGKGSLSFESAANEVPRTVLALRLAILPGGKLMHCRIIRHFAGKRLSAIACSEWEVACNWEQSWCATEQHNRLSVVLPTSPTSEQKEYRAARSAASKTKTRRIGPLGLSTGYLPPSNEPGAPQVWSCAAGSSVRNSTQTAPAASAQHSKDPDDECDNHADRDDQDGKPASSR